MRTFDTGATRDSDDTKPDLEGFLSPAVLNSYAAYMTRNRKQADGNLRDSDNWQKGIPFDAYMKSMFRHFMEVWGMHRGVRDGVMEDSLNALLFNVMGYQFEHLRQSQVPVESSFLTSYDKSPLPRIVGAAYGTAPGRAVEVHYPNGATRPVPVTDSDSYMKDWPHAGSPYKDWHSACGAASSEEDVTEAIEGIAAEGPKDGWYDWNPTPGQRTLILPVHKDTVVRCRFRDGSERVDRAGSLDWWHTSEPIDWPGDIIAFRLETAPLEVSDFSNAPWIEWKHGSKVPRELVDIKFQDGTKVHGIAPASVNWWSNNLVAYRLHEETDDGNAVDGP